MTEGASTLKRKLPELLIEAGFVVLAILLALAADEWRENRERAKLGERALESIEAEMRTNRDELAESRSLNRELLASLQEEVSDGEPAADLNVQFEYSTLSDAAWETAQVTQAAHEMDYDLVQQIARLYDLQELFGENQRAMVNQMGGMADVMTSDPDAFARSMLARLGIVMSVDAGLSVVLDSMIVVMENR